MERYAPRVDALAFTFRRDGASFCRLLVVAIALGDLGVRMAGRVGTLLVTGVFASALGYLVQTWAQRRTSRRARRWRSRWTGVARVFGYTLAGDRLGALGWGGCAAIMAGIVLREPAAAPCSSASVASRRGSRGRSRPDDDERDQAD